MKCPILAPTPAETSLGELWKAVDCLKEECAWWNRDKQECVIVGYQRACDDLADTLAEIRMKLTPELSRER